MQIKELFLSAVGKENILPPRIAHHNLERAGSGLSVEANDSFTRLSGSGKNLEQVNALADFRLPGGTCRNAEEIREADQF